MSYYCIVLIVIIAVILCYHKRVTVNRLQDFTIKKEYLDVIYPDMKSGDLLLVTDSDYDLKKIYILYKHNDAEDQMKYINKREDNYLELVPIVNLIDKYKNKKVLWMRLRAKLSEESIRGVETALRAYYPQEMDINAVLSYNNDYRDFFYCPMYMAKILFEMGTMNIIRPSCLSDPAECYQQFYKNSSFLQGTKYDTNNLTELI